MEAKFREKQEKRRRRQAEQQVWLVSTRWYPSESDA